MKQLRELKVTDASIMEADVSFSGRVLIRDLQLSEFAFKQYLMTTREVFG